jgi:signal transduction histidine kinase
MTFARVTASRAAALRRTLAARDESIRKLTDANTGFQSYLRVAEENSKSDERNRIIRELHDSIGYTLTTIIMLSESGLERSKLAERDRFTEIFEPIRESAKDCLTDVRVALRLMKARKDPIPDTNALLRLTRAFEAATNVRIELNFGNVPAWFGAGADSLVFRIIQEGLVNAFRHGGAKRIRIGLWIDGGLFRVSIRDDGSGGGDMTKGLGTMGMRERVEAAGGSLEFFRTMDGFILSASFHYPISAAMKAQEEDQ